MVNRIGYASYDVDEYLEDAERFLEGKEFEKTKRLAEALGLQGERQSTGKRAAAIFYRLDWERWANGKGSTTFRRPEA